MTRSGIGTIGLLAVGLIAGLAIGRVSALRHPAAGPPATTPAVSVTSSTPMRAVCQKGCRESFDALTFATTPTWQRDVARTDQPYSDDGSWFHQQSLMFRPPEAVRISAPLGSERFLTLEAYSRTRKDHAALFAVVADPADASNRVLRLSSPEHTDGVILRTSQPLGAHYEICARVGWMDFGTGDGLNGYDGDERNEPWSQGSGSAVDENGFYYGALYHAVPKPQNNIAAHFERLAFIDSDNNTEGWTSIWDPAVRWFVRSGWHPIVMGAVPRPTGVVGSGGPPFVTYAGGDWNPPGKVYAVDAYQEQQWYTACFARNDTQLTWRLSGTFRFGGQTTYEATLSDASGLADFDQPHYWMLGDPHVNYYEGSLLVDDVTLRVSP